MRASIGRKLIAGGVAGLLALALASCAPESPEPAFVGSTRRLSLATGDQQIAGPSSGGSVDGAGRWLAFTTFAGVDPSDVNGLDDIYVRNPDDGVTRLMSASPFGPSNGASVDPRLSGDGAFVTFTSSSSILSTWDGNGVSDVFVTNVLAGVPFPVSAASGTFAFTGNGASHGAVPDRDGNAIAFTTEASNLTSGDTNGVADAVVRDMLTGTITPVSVASDGTPGNLPSTVTDISGDGRYVGFVSLASNLVPGDTNGATDHFVRDRVAGTTTRVDVAANGSQATGSTPGGEVRVLVSDDGRFAVFDSTAPNLVPGDTNGVSDVFRRDLSTGSTERVSVRSDGGQLTKASRLTGLSDDGRFSMFVTLDPGSSFNGLGSVRDVAAATTTEVTLRNGSTVSSLTTLAVPPDIDMPVAVFRNVGYSPEATLSGDGRSVVWTTAEPGVGDTNEDLDVYRRQWRP